MKPSNRRTTKVNGFVNFPVHSSSSQEGGMFVRLVVYQTTEQWNDNKWMMCCGGNNYVIYDEVYCGSDINPPIEINYAKISSVEEYKKLAVKSHKYQELHFPNLEDYEKEHCYTSIPYLCVVNLGSTGWSSSDFICKYEDLTDEGKKLYNNIKLLYGTDCIVELQTWLDT